MISSPTPFFRRDSRANKLLRWTAVDDVHGRGHVLWLGGPSEVADQVCAVASEYVYLLLNAQARQEGWTHALRAKGPFCKDVEELLLLLQEVLSLPAPPRMDTAIALDWYKRADDAIDSYSWLNTEVGELVHRGKYSYRHRPALQAQVGRELVQRICEVIRKHPGFRRATIVLDVPGHDSAQVSFGSRLAESVAKELSIPMMRTSTRTGFRPPAKGAELAERKAAIENQFFLEGNLSFHNVLVLDDVFRSGTSLGETGRAAKAAGAGRVDGIVAVRTRRAR
jgi:hypothetical protein